MNNSYLKQRGFLLNPFRFAKTVADDPYFGMVTALISFEDGTAKDYSLHGNTLSTVSGTYAVVSPGVFSTQQADFVNGCVYDSTYRYNSGFQADFTIELFHTKTSNSANGYDNIVTNDTANGSGTNGWFVEISQNRGFVFVADGAVRISYAAIPTDTLPHHYAITRKGSTLRMFIDGILVASATSTMYFNNLGLLGIGGNNASTSYRARCKVDELRITRGFCRYETNFSVFEGVNPTKGAYSSDPFWADTLLYYGFNSPVGTTNVTDLTGKSTRSYQLGSVVFSNTRKFYGDTSLYNNHQFYVVDQLSEAIGTGPFTVEAIISLNSNNGTIQQWAAFRCFHSSPTGVPRNNMGVEMFNYRNWGVRVHGNYYTTTGWDKIINWSHLVIVGNGGPDGSRDVKVYVDGHLARSVNVNYNFTDRYCSTGTGYDQDYMMNGYMAMMRVTKANRYPSGVITPPSLPPTKA